MLRLLRARPFLILIPGALLLLGLILLVRNTEPRHSRARSPRADVGQFEYLAQPPLPADQLVRRAEEFLVDRGYETESLVGYLLVGVRHSENLFHAYRMVSPSGNSARASRGFAMPSGFSFWAAMLSSTLLAFGMGLARSDAPLQVVRIGAGTVGIEKMLRLTLLIGIGSAVVIALIQAAAMPLDKWYTDLIALGILLTVALFTWVWVLVRRHVPAQPPAGTADVPRQEWR